MLNRPRVTHYRFLVNVFAGAVCSTGLAFIGCSGSDEADPSIRQSSDSLHHGENGVPNARHHHPPRPGHHGRHGRGDDDDGGDADAGSGGSGTGTGGAPSGDGGATGGTSGSGGTAGEGGSAGSSTGGTGGSSTGGGAGEPSGGTGGEAGAGGSSTGGSGGSDVCGDGAWGYSEQCDDGNTISGDGCSETCTIEPGYSCSWGACHLVVCGDGLVDWYPTPEGYDASEGCDDGNTASGDGCSSTCDIESGWYCPEPGAPCRQPTCGDGYLDCIFVPGDGTGDMDGGIAGAGGSIGGAGGTSTGGAGGSGSGYYICEQCDDGNATSGDGCSSTCDIESGWYCPAPGIPCRQPTCGDGYLDYIFVPGDGTGDMDGGIAGAGGSTGGAGGTSTGGAGGTSTGGASTGAGGSGGGYYIYEQCDDGNTTSGDGCSSACEIESGWYCPDPPGMPCRQPICGNGYIDYIFVPGDGTGSTDGGIGGTGGASTGGAPGTGGSGGYYVYEECDDGNTISGDGCSETCTIEY